MTGGQVSPTTPSGAKSSTTPYGNVEPAMDVSKLALGAGATFVARAHTANPVYLGQLIRRALEHDGFSVLEVLSQCPTYFGRLVRGDFETRSDNNHENKLTAGTLEVKGNFTRKAGVSANFKASGTHRVVLSGEKQQTIDFSSTNIQQFNILENKIHQGKS